MPVELSRETLASIQAERPDKVETEVFVYGRLPLAYSARCFTARYHDLPKDDCQYRCLDDPEGLTVSTREGQAFLTINGIQTQSAQTCNLLPELAELRELQGGCAADQPTTGRYGNSDRSVRRLSARGTRSGRSCGSKC
jgi:collagenase-like PrtC family protease